MTGKALPILLAALLSASATLHAQTASEFRVAADSLRARMERRTRVKVPLKLSKVKKRGTTLDFYFSQELSDFPWRMADVEWFREELRSLAPPAYRAYTLGDIFAKEVDLNRLPMPEIGKNGGPVETDLRTGDPKGRTIPLVRTDEKWSRGLSGRHIALWQSHGRYYEAKTDRWEWQRAATHRTVEDMYTQGYVLPYLIPMLENAGAVVVTPRERDIQSWEVVCDNDPSFKEERTGRMRRTGLYKETGPWEAAGPGFSDTKPVYHVYENPFETGTARICETSSGEGKASVTWRPDIPVRGEYAVYVSYRSFPNSTTDAVYTVHHMGGESVFHVNQRMGEIGRASCRERV